MYFLLPVVSCAVNMIFYVALRSCSFIIINYDRPLAMVGRSSGNYTLDWQLLSGQVQTASPIIVAVCLRSAGGPAVTLWVLR